ncbi:MAG: hypothetical protein FWG96_00990 [Methanomassiliicoccaceae archaeon]|nr:hypothetical protein [Methanomassiliicoccaceae archaeon]
MSDKPPSFCDRVEYNILIDKLKENMMVVVDAGTGRGVSSFARNFKDKRKGTMVIYRPDWNMENLHSLLIDAIFSDIGKKPIKELHSYEKNFLLDIEAHKHMGGDYQRLHAACEEIRDFEALPKNLGKRAKDINESFKRYFEGMHETLVGVRYPVVIIDTADNLNKKDRYLLEYLIRSECVQLVLIFKVIVNEREIESYDSASPMIFSNLPMSLIEKLFNSDTPKNLRISEKEIKALEGRRNVQEVMQKYWEVRGGFPKPDEYGKCIHNIVSSCGKINIIDLRKIMENIFRPEIFYKKKEKINNAIESQKQNILFDINYSNGYLSSEETSQIYSVDNVEWDGETIKHFLDKYRGPNKNKDIRTAQILYKILTEDKVSKDLIIFSDVDEKECARSVLKCKLRSGADIEGEECELIITNEDDKLDAELKILSFCRRYDYEKALKKIEEKELHKNNSEYRRLRAVLLNRTYKFHTGLVELNMAYAFEKDSAMKNILASYIIASYIHLGRYEEAKPFFESHMASSPVEENLGYVYRNFASTMGELEKRIPCYEKAKRLFENKDDFGFFSTESNLGYVLTRLKKPGISESLNNALAGLTQTDGGEKERDLCIILNNIGISLLYDEDPERRREFMELYKRARKLEKTPVQECFITINLAYYYISEKNYPEASACLKGIEEKVEKLGSIVKQQYYPACALAAYYNMNRDELIKYVNESEYYGNRTDLEMVKANNAIYYSFIKNKTKKCKTDWKDFFIPGGLFYYYVDPLRLISQKTIDEIIS